MTINPQIQPQDSAQDASVDNSWIRLPKADADDGQWQEFFTQLRPQTSGEYPITPQQDDFYDQELLDAFKQAAHKAGLSAKQASILHDEMLRILHEKMSAMGQMQRQQTAQVASQLKSKWGADFHKNMDAAKKGAQYMGLPEEALQALENHIGGTALLEGLSRIGLLLGEDTQLRNMPSSTGAMSVDEARRKRAQLTHDENFAKELFDKTHPNHQMAVAELQRLNEIIASK